MKRWLLVVILVLVASTVRADSWYKVACHSGHTKDYSDGARSFPALVAKAKSCGFQVIVLVDHVEQIAQKPNGFTKYLTDCAKSYDGITLISGVEVTTSKAHTVVFGHLSEESLDKLNKVKTVLDVAAVAKEYNLITVAAHPFNKLNPYDRKNAADINGHEWFNDTALNYRNDLDWLMKRQKAGWCGFNWAGIDSHTPADPSDTERWRRQTRIYAKSSSIGDILTAFRLGRTYVSLEYWLENLSSIPGSEVQKTKPRLCFTVKRSPVAITNSHRVRIYRDNELVESQWFYPGKTSKTIDYQDKNCPSGIHHYIIEVEQCLITSPITVNVFSTIVEKPIVYSGGLPVLLGKSQDEVRRILGDNILVTDQTDFVIDYRDRNDPSVISKKWFYGNIDKLIKKFWANVYYVPFNNDNRRDTSKDPIYKTVQWVSIKRNSQQYEGSKPLVVFPKQLVPEVILRQTPAEICRLNDFFREDMIVIWYFQGNTFVLGIHDTNKKLYDETTDQTTGRKKWRLNKNGLNFRNANDAFMFIQVSGTPQLFGHRDWWERDDMSDVPLKDRGAFAGESAYFYRFID